jgi:hypothetical protein
LHEHFFPDTGIIEFSSIHRWSDLKARIGARAEDTASELNLNSICSISFSVDGLLGDKNPLARRNGPGFLSLYPLPDRK